MRRLLAALIVALALQAGSSGAAPMEGVDFVRIEPQPVPDGKRIEVVEFFYYGCGACYRLEPYLSRWLAQLPADVEFRRVPALRRTSWIPLTQLYLTLSDLGVLPRLHAEVFRAIHAQGRSLQTREDMVEWASEHGVDGPIFEATLKSDAILIATQASRDATVAYGIRDTPSLVVDGRFLTSGAMLGDITRLVPVLDELVALARAER